MAYKLAAKLGQPNVDKMLRQMSFKQFREWIAYAELEPFDESRDDYRIASIVATLINLKRGKRKAVSVDDVRLLFGDEKKIERKQSVLEQIQIGLLVAGFYNHKEDEKAQKKALADDRRKSRDTVRKSIIGR